MAVNRPAYRMKFRLNKSPRTSADPHPSLAGAPAQCCGGTVYSTVHRNKVSRFPHHIFRILGPGKKTPFTYVLLFRKHSPVNTVKSETTRSQSNFLAAWTKLSVASWVSQSSLSMNCRYSPLAVSMAWLRLSDTPVFSLLMTRKRRSIFHIPGRFPGWYPGFRHLLRLFPCPGRSVPWRCSDSAADIFPHCRQV